MKIKWKKVVLNVIKILIILVVLFPFFWLFISSFKYEKDIMTFPPKIFAPEYTLENYKKVFSYIPLFSYAKNTVIFSGGIVLAQLLLDSLAAYAMARLEFKGKKVLSYIILLTMMIPFQVYMIPLFIEINAMGLMDSFAGLILPRMVMPFGIFLMRTAFVSLPKNLEEAARIDGLSEFGIFWKIMLPLCKPTLLTLAIITLMNNWNDLLYPLLLTSDVSKRTLAAGLALFVGENITKYGPVMAGTVISIIPLLIAYMFAQKYFIAGVAMSGSKE